MFKHLPGTIASRRMMVMTEGAMLNIFPKETSLPHDVPVYVVRREIHGKMIESAQLHPEAIGLGVQFGLRFMELGSSDATYTPLKEDGAEKASHFIQSVDTFITSAKSSSGIYSVALRYVRNLANGRWLAANLIDADQAVITIRVRQGDREIEQFSFQPQNIPYNHFEANSPDEKRLAEYIESSLNGTCKTSLEITAELFQDGIKGFKVYPSTEVTDMPGQYLHKSRLNHSCNMRDNPSNEVVGQALISDMDIRKALRVVDTWNNADNNRPKSVQLTPQAPQAKCFLHLNSVDPESDSGLFAIANLIQGFKCQGLYI